MGDPASNGACDGAAGEAAFAPGLRLLNSLTNSKELFVPASGGRLVTEYICGPTVYASSHLGHARNYVSFDVLRRVMEDYFGYTVRFVMNITDVDDKIILRARQDFLLKRYQGATTDPQQVATDVASALASAEAKQDAKVAAARELAASGGSESVLKARQTAVAEEVLKRDQLTAIRAAVQGLGPAPTSAAMYEAASDVLSTWLDAREGAEVTDPDVFRLHATRYEAEFLEDMRTLGVREADAVTRVSEYVPAIVAYTQGIVDRGLAYAAGGSVYFDTRAFRAAGHKYGKLAPHAVESADLASEGEANFSTADKRSPADFALWKAARPGEPRWPSPWGEGRPGWHIECSAMCADVHGAALDLHGGGVDLKFPHHDNEIAQCEAHTGCHTWVRTFLHSGHLNIAGLKMSKSLKNFISIRGALASGATARQLRLFFVAFPWHASLNFSDDNMEYVKAKEKALKGFFQNVAVLSREHGLGTGRPADWGPPEFALGAAVDAADASVRARLQDNVDTPGAMEALTELIREVNAYLTRRGGAAGTAPAGGDALAVGGGIRIHIVRKAAALVRRILAIFGLDFEDGAGSAAEGGEDTATGSGAVLDAMAAFRQQVRELARGLPAEAKGPILSLCDRLRDEVLPEAGVRLEDRPDGSSVWKREAPAVLRAERDEAALRSLAVKLKSKQKDLAKWEAAALPPEDCFRAELSGPKPKYGQLDARGVPSHDAAGKPIADKARKALEKAMDKAEEAAAQLRAKPADFLSALRAEVAELAAQEAALEQRLGRGPGGS